MKVVTGKRIVDAYQRIYYHAHEQDYGIIGLVHDDLVCLEPDWDFRVMHEFLDPRVGVVGFAGGTRHGSPDLYVKPYTASQLARGGFLSNLRDAEVHGKRFKGECDVAVLDGIALFVRREVIDQMGGWTNGGNIDYFLYSEMLCCWARRLGYKIRLVGVAVDHLGGKSTGLNPNLNANYEGEHLWLYQNFRDCLPFEV